MWTLTTVTIIIMAILKGQLVDSQNFSIQSSSGDVLKAQNDTAYLECSSNSRWHTCQWHYTPSIDKQCTFISANTTDDSLPRDQNCTGSLTSMRGQFFGDWNKCGLELSDIGDEDHGEWSCVMEECDESSHCLNSNGISVSAFLNVTVLYDVSQGQAFFYPRPPDDILILDEFEETTLNCVAQNFRPVPTIGWVFGPPSFEYEDEFYDSRDQSWECEGCILVNTTSDGIVTVAKSERVIGHPVLNGTLLKCEIILLNQTSEGNDTDRVYKLVQAVTIIISQQDSSTTMDETSGTSENIISTSDIESTSIATTSNPATGTASVAEDTTLQEETTFIQTATTTQTESHSDFTTISSLITTTTLSSISEQDSIIFILLMIIITVLCLSLIYLGFMILYKMNLYKLDSSYV